MKVDGRFEEYRSKQNQQIKKFRSKRSAEQIQLDREQTRLGVQRCRANKKEQGLPLNSTPKVVTRAGLGAKREKAR